MRRRLLSVGEPQHLAVGPITHDLQLWCTLPGHKMFGMSLTIHVAGRSGGRGASASGRGKQRI